MTDLEEVLKRAAADLNAVGAKWTIIGGLAVATRAALRFTQDVDFAVSVADDAEAEDIVHRMSVRGSFPESPRSSWTCSSAVQGSRTRSWPARTAWKSGRRSACR
jgi:endonuclease V-like protein UPF0215 family